jgi:hypothetical protein
MVGNAPWQEWLNQRERRIRSVHLVQVEKFKPQIVPIPRADWDNGFLKKISQCLLSFRITVPPGKTFTEPVAGTHRRTLLLR